MTWQLCPWEVARLQVCLPAPLLTEEEAESPGKASIILKYRLPITDSSVPQSLPCRAFLCAVSEGLCRGTPCGTKSAKAL